MNLRNASEGECVEIQTAVISSLPEDDLWLTCVALIMYPKVMSSVPRRNGRKYHPVLREQKRICAGNVFPFRFKGFNRTGFEDFSRSGHTNAYC